MSKEGQQLHINQCAAATYNYYQSSENVVTFANSTCGDVAIMHTAHYL
jgi:hypothetical protein